MYNKRTKQWTIVPEKAPKEYNYISELQEQILQNRLQDERSVTRKRPLRSDDPRKIARTIASVPPPATQDLVARHKSRFGSSKKLKLEGKNSD